MHLNAGRDIGDVVAFRALNTGWRHAKAEQTPPRF